MSLNGFNDHTASDIPPAPVLKFPIPLKPKGKLKAPSSTTKAPTKPVDPERPLTPDAEFFVLDVEDVRTITREDRMRLLEGPTVKVTCDKQFVTTIPLQLALAASQTVRTQYLNKTKNIPQFGIAGRLYKDALRLLMDWLKDSITKRKCYWLPRQMTFSQDVNLVAVAVQLGMEIYVKHIIDPMWAILKRDRLDFPKLLAIERAAPDPSFALFKCAVERLAHMRLYDEVEDEEEYDSWLERLPHIGTAVYPRYEEMAAARYSRQLIKLQEKEKDAKEKAEEASIRRLVAEQRLAAKEEIIAKEAEHLRIKTENEEQLQKEKELRDSAQRKLNSGRVNVITAEEAQFIRRRGSVGRV